jgi:hypothetical protein
MIDQWDKTVHDRKFDIPGNEPQKIEHTIILTIIGGNEIDFGKHFLLEKNKYISAGMKPMTLPSMMKKSAKSTVKY